MLRLAVCGAAAAALVVPSPAHAADHAHVIVGFQYLPPSGAAGTPVLAESVTAGDTLTFTNLDALAHTVTFDDFSFNSGPVGVGGTIVVPTTGIASGTTVRYHCTIHGALLMSGAFTVS
jgi:plastocyanin